MVAKNWNEVSLDNLVKIIADETKAKGTLEEKGGKRRSIALQIAMTYPDTAATWSGWVVSLNSGDDKSKSATREKIIATFGGADLEGTVKTNHVRRAIDAITFATDMIKLGYAENIVFNERGGATVAGSTPLANEIWRVYKWHDNKNMQDRSVSEAIKINARQSEKKTGEVSWPMIENVVRTKAGRKASGQSAKAGGKTITPDKPIEMLKSLGSMAGDVDPVHFQNDASLIAAINTSEDVLALALSNDKLKAYAKRFEELFEQARAELHMSKGIETKAA